MQYGFASTRVFDTKLFKDKRAGLTTSINVERQYLCLG